MDEGRLINPVYRFELWMQENHLDLFEEWEESEASAWCDLDDWLEAHYWYVLDEYEKFQKEK